MGLFTRTQKQLDDALLKAVSRHKIKKAKALIEKGARIDAVDEGGNTVLHKLASYYPYESDDYEPTQLKTRKDVHEFLSLLKNRNFDMCVRNKKGETCLFALCARKDGGSDVESAAHDLQEMLIQFGVDRTFQDNQGRTAFHIASYFGRKDLFCPDSSPVHCMQDNAGKYAYDYAADGGHHSYSLKLMGRWQAYQQSRLTPVEPPPVAVKEKPAAPVEDTQWHMTEVAEIARVCVKKALGITVRETFNFHRRVYTRTETDEKNAVMVSQSFDDYADKKMFEDAWERLTEKGGQVDRRAIGGTLIIKKLEPST